MPITTERRKRTQRQNASLHKLMAEISSELNDHGMYMTQVLRHDAEIAWSPEMVKELLFRPFIRAMYKKESTRDLDTKEIGDAMDAMLDHLAKVTGIALEIPSVESLINQQRVKN